MCQVTVGTRDVISNLSVIRDRSLIVSCSTTWYAAVETLPHTQRHTHTHAHTYLFSYVSEDIIDVILSLAACNPDTKTPF